MTSGSKSLWERVLLLLGIVICFFVIRTLPVGAFPTLTTPDETVGPLVSSPSAVAVVDANNDGYEDLLVGSFYGGIRVFLYSEASRTFASTPATTMIVDSLSHDRKVETIQVVDLDGDGDCDIVAHGIFGWDVAVFREERQGDLYYSTSPQLRLWTRGICTLGTGKFGGDTRPDIVVGTSSGSLLFFCQPFTDEQLPESNRTVALPFSERPTLAVGDFNNDGLDDVAVGNTHAKGSASVYVYLQNTNGTFPAEADKILNAGDHPHALAAGDLNDDGLVDLAVTLESWFSHNGLDPVAVFFQADETGLPTTPTLTPNVPDSPSRTYPLIDDLNDNGLNDLAVTIDQMTGYDRGGTYIFYQTTDTHTLPTNADLILTNTSQTSNAVLFDVNGDSHSDLVTVNVGTGTERSYANVFYQDPPRIDLKASGLSIPSSTPANSVLVETTVDITATVMNVGADVATNVEVKLLVDGVQLGEVQTIDSLGAGASEDRIWPWSPTGATAIGTHALKVVVNPDDKITESNRLNNNEVLEVTVKAADLHPLNVSVVGTASGATVSTQIENLGTGGTAGQDVLVRFYIDDCIPENQMEDDQWIECPSPGQPPETETASVTWADPQGECTIHVRVDPEGDITERDETNNGASLTLPAAPTVSGIIPMYDDTKVEAAELTVLANGSTEVEYVANVDSIDPISNVVFTLSGPSTNVYTDTVDSDGWSWPLDFQGYPDGDYTLTAQATDVSGLTSDYYSPGYTIHVVSFPPWFSTLQLADTFEITLSDAGVLCYTIKAKIPWGFFNEDDDGAGSGNDPLTGDNKTSTSTDAQVSVQLYSDGTFKLSGGVSGKANMIGKPPVFVTDVSAGFTVGGEGHRTDHTLELTSGFVNVELSVTLEHIYGIIIPHLDWKTGITISAIPKLTVDYSFSSTAGSFDTESQELEVTVGARLEGGLALGSPNAIWPCPYGVGAEVYGYAEPRLIGQIPGSPAFSIDVSVGAGGSVYYCIGKWSGEIEAARWSWPSGRDVTDTTMTWTPNPRYGDAHPAGTNLVLWSDTLYDGPPYLTYDYTLIPYAIWTQDTASPNDTEVVVSHLEDETWVAPTQITSTSNDRLDLCPVLAFDATYNKGLAVWVRNMADISTSSSCPEILDTYGETEIYYAVYSDGTWGSEQRLTADIAAEMPPAIAVDPSSSRIMVVWARDPDGIRDTSAHPDIYYAVWDAETEEWTTEPKVAVSLADLDAQPAVAFDSQGRALLVWAHDEDSNESSFDDQPPHITRLWATPNPAALGEPVILAAKVLDDRIVAWVNAIVTLPDGGNQTVPMPFNAGTGFYEGTVSTAISGTYNVLVEAVDRVGQFHMAATAFSVAMPDAPPIIQDLFISRRVMHLNDVVEVSATIYDDIGIESIETFVEPGHKPVQLDDPEKDGTYTGVFTEDTLPWDYELRVTALDSSGQKSVATTEFRVAAPMDTEIYYAEYIGDAWTFPTPITDRYDYHASRRPDVVFDSNEDNEDEVNVGWMVWEEELENGNTRNYQALLKKDPSGYNFLRQGESVGTRYGDREPQLAATNNGYVMLTWRSDDNYSLWPEVWWAVIDATATSTVDPYGEFATPAWGGPERLTFNDIVDWQPQLAIEPNTNQVVLAWPAHRTTITGTLGAGDFDMARDDDDLYYETFPFPFGSADANEITRLSDGSRRTTLTFDGTHPETVIFKVPEFAHPQWDARVELTGLPNIFGEYPADVRVYLGGDDDFEIAYSVLTGTQTYYLSATDMYAALDGYLEAHRYKEAADGTPDGQIEVPLVISTTTPGARIRLEGLSIGFSFEPRQRPASACNESPDLWPQLKPIPDVVVDEGQEAIITVEATDPSGDVLVYSIDDPQYSQRHDVFTWQTAEGDEGIYSVQVSASDCSDVGSDVGSQAVTVTVLDENKPPEIERVDIVFSESGLVKLTVFATDVNGDDLVYSIDDARFAQRGNVFTWQPGSDDAGGYTVTVTASDGVYEDSQAIEVVVE